MTEPQNVFLMGASTRAMAFSALRAGLRPWCADLFGDTDLRNLCSVHTIALEDYPNGFLSIASQFPTAPILFTGGLENHPQFLQRMSQQRPLWGCSSASIAKVRDPFFLFDLWQKHGVAALPVSKRVPKIDFQNRWLRKPLQSAGGLNISLVRDSTKTHSAYYFQKYKDGVPISCLYCMARGQAKFLGATLQLVGEPAIFAQPFQYCGNIVLPLQESSDITAIGQALCAVNGLQGLLGVDAILMDQIYPVEVNPRYTASVEILEYAKQESFLLKHCQCFDTSLNIKDSMSPLPSGFLGKAILYAPVEFTFPEKGPWLGTTQDTNNLWQMPRFADVPKSGMRIGKGDPIFTFYFELETGELSFVRKYLKDTVAHLCKDLWDVDE